MQSLHPVLSMPTKSLKTLSISLGMGQICKYIYHVCWHRKGLRTTDCINILFLTKLEDMLQHREAQCCVCTFLHAFVLYCPQCLPFCYLAFISHRWVVFFSYHFNTLTLNTKLTLRSWTHKRLQTQLCICRENIPSYGEILPICQGEQNAWELKFNLQAWQINFLSFTNYRSQMRVFSKPSRMQWWGQFY